MDQPQTKSHFSFLLLHIGVQAIIGLIVGSSAHHFDDGMLGMLGPILVLLATPIVCILIALLLAFINDHHQDPFIREGYRKGFKASFIFWLLYFIIWMAVVANFVN